jgi:hypothetical protein
MQRYIAHALSLEPLAALRTSGSPKARKEIPSPKARASIAKRTMKNGSWPADGSGPPAAGGQITGPNRKAGTPKRAVTTNTFIHVFMVWMYLS